MVSKGECSWGIKGKSQDGGKQCEDWKMVLGELRGSGLWSVLREWWEMGKIPSFGQFHGCSEGF